MTVKVLIIDDSVMMQMIVSEIVKSDSALEVIGTADNGMDGIEKVRALKPDVVLLDIEMPVMNGLDCMKRLKLESKAKVIILSSVAQVGSAQAIEARQLGAADVIAKPSGAVSLDLSAKKGHVITQAVKNVAGV
ncbi:MAG: response regulator [Methylococcales bacterium]|jgi:two-component system, chemotaxis family, protein-glutamate methylesterase/glutaminase|nr:response regulator [Methylococcales bacterium]MBT7409303.1 response regulator [Methylococcales bacterium]